MKISEGHTKTIDAPATGGVSADSSVKKGKDKDVSRSEDTSGSVKVTVSEQAKKLAASQTIDTAKVDKLKAKIADGSFEIDAAAIANKIVGGNDE